MKLRLNDSYAFINLDTMKWEAVRLIDVCRSVLRGKLFRGGRLGATCIYNKADFLRPERKARLMLCPKERL